MSYKYETQYNSPNYTPKSQVYATWGRPRTIEAIAIHWWGDPNTNPTYEGVINYLCRPNGNSSAHFVATGTGRRVACLINLEDASWATNGANPYTISIECDPRCRDEDYDVVAELIAQIRQVYGPIPLTPHNHHTSTQCPGNYDLNRLNAIAATKIARPEDDWGTVHNKVVEPPKPTVSEDKAKRVTYDKVKKFKFKTNARLYEILTGKPTGNTAYEAGKEIELKQELTLTDGSKWYRTEYYANKEIGNGFRAEDVEEVKAPEKSNITQIHQIRSEEKSLENEKMNSNSSLDSKSILPDSSSGTNDNVDKNSSCKISEEDMSNIKKIEDESAAILSAVEFNPVIPEQVKLKTYFTTGSLLIATTLASSIAIALIPDNAILIMAIAGALNTAYASVNQLFKISSKK